MHVYFIIDERIVCLRRRGEMTMANVFDVANFFIELAGQDEEGFITHLQLQKLLYFAHGYFLAKTGFPLFTDAVEAWEYGPVVPSVYSKYEKYEKNPITPVNADLSDSFTDEEYEVLLDTAREYCKFAAWYLVSLTHAQGTPWFMTRAKTNRRTVIDNTLIRSYFSGKTRSFDRILESKMAAPIGYRDSEGYLVLPVEEDEGAWN
jgi:uncharacterized phage-associated protein